MNSWRVIAVVPLGLDTGVDPNGGIGAAAEIAGEAGVEVEALVLGHGFDEAAARQAAQAGAHRVAFYLHAGLAQPPGAEQMLAVAQAALRDAGVAEGAPALVLFPASPGGGGPPPPRLSVRFHGAAFGRCGHIGLDGDEAIARRAAFGGRAQVTLSCRSRPCFATMRARPRPADARSPCEAARIELATPLPEDVAVERRAPSGAARPLEGARLVVCGGRGIGGEEGFARLEELARLLGGVVGGSLPAVDAGWTSVSQQVGQSGRYVTPDIYLGVGISGTPQHMAGIGPDTRILAINSDASAEIFRHAEAGLVADWREALPALIDRLRTPS